MKTGDQGTTMSGRAWGRSARRSGLMCLVVAGILMALLLAACATAPAVTTTPIAEGSDGEDPATATVAVTPLPTETAPAGPTVQPTLSPEERAEMIALLAEKSAEGTRHYLGDAAAPLTMIEFSDYQ